MKKTSMVAGTAKKMCQEDMINHPENFTENDIKLMKEYGGNEPTYYFRDSMAFSILMNEIILPLAEKNNISIVRI